MMNPEPSERLSGRPGPCPGPGGCWRGMKRRKNSWISSSSIPGTCGTAPVRRGACVVLMLTTALPWSSTSRVKSGRTCVCAAPAAQNPASQRAASALTNRIVLSWSILLLRATVLDRVRDPLHAGGRRLADHGHHVVGDLARIDMDGTHACKPGAHAAAALEGLDEPRHRRQAVGI